MTATADAAFQLACDWDNYADDEARAASLQGDACERERVLRHARSMVETRARNMEAQEEGKAKAKRAGPRIIGRTASELLAEVPEEVVWDIPGVSAPGWLVKIAAREKVGKGTFMFNLIGSMERGERTVFGPSARKSTLIYTEEPQESVREKVALSRLERSRVIYGYEFAKVEVYEWHEKVDWLVWIAAEEGHGALFVDNVSRAAGVEEEAGVELARAAEYLGEKAKAAGLTTYIDHHHKKGASALSDKSRGGTALAGACDNNVEMVREGPWGSRVRALSSRGRLRATIWERKIALSDDGTTYEEVAGVGGPQTVEERGRLRALAKAGEEGMTAAEFAAAIEKSDPTARRALGDFVEHGWADEDSSAWPHRWVATGQGKAHADDEAIPL